MNYRHAFHAGNFADVLKHAVLLQLLGHATCRPEPLFALDTHAGAGLYRLAEARTQEAAGGIGRVLADPSPPAALQPLVAAVRALGRDLYPGSPWLIAQALRPRDRYVGCELRPDDHALLAQTLQPIPGATARLEDGYDGVATALPERWRNALVLIDPPFERGDEARRATAAIGAALDRAPSAIVCLWAPIKDLEGFDALVRGLETFAPFVVELRLRPLRNPLTMNGSALLVFNMPETLVPAVEEIVGWCAARLGEPGAIGGAWRV